MKRTEAFQKRRYVVAGDWVQIIAPISCNYVGLRHLGAADGEESHVASVILRTDEDDPDTEDAMAPYAQDGVTAMFRPVGYGGRRFEKGDCLASIKTGSNYPQVIVVTWVH
jgi:hypothetical protein